jgi:hypothetical protein
VETDGKTSVVHTQLELAIKISEDSQLALDCEKYLNIHIGVYLCIEKCGPVSDSVLFFIYSVRGSDLLRNQARFGL